MKRYAAVVAAVVMAVMLIATAAFAGKTYQVTGVVKELKDNVIVVEKGKERWELTKDAGTKVKGDLKVGAKVTIQYEMKAADIAVKAK